MKKIITFLLILTFGFAITTSPVDAAFWSKWFNKDKEVKTEQVIKVEQPVKQSFWSRVVNVFKKDPKQVEMVEKKPEVNEDNVNARINALKNIGEGKHSGKTNLDFTFTQEEIDKVGTPYLNSEISKNNKSGGKIVLNSINLRKNSIEAKINIEKPLNGNVYIRIIPTVLDGKISLSLDSVRFKGFSVPKSILEKLLNGYNVDPDNLVFPVPYTNLTSIQITKNDINMVGVYVGK